MKAVLTVLGSQLTAVIAGSVKDVDSIRERLSALQPARLFISEKPGEIENLARESVEAGFEQIVSAGGDGTLNEVVNGIEDAGGNIILALVPLGTGNDFARTLGVPMDIDEAIEQILRGQTREIDLVRVTSDLVRHALSHLEAPPGLSGMRNDLRQFDAAKRAGVPAYDVSVPTLVVHGDADPVVGVDQARFHASAIAGAGTSRKMCSGRIPVRRASGNDALGALSVNLMRAPSTPSTLTSLQNLALG